jgi:hypothetical protein
MGEGRGGAREHMSALAAEAEAEAMAAAAAAASVHKATEAEASSREHEQQRALQDRYERLPCQCTRGRPAAPQAEEAEHRKRQRAAAGGE